MFHVASWYFLVKTAPRCACHPRKISKMLSGGSLSAWEERVGTLCSSTQWELCRNFECWSVFFSHYIWCQFSPPEGCALGSLQLLDSRIILLGIREALTSVTVKHPLEQNWSEIGWSGISYQQAHLLLCNHGAQWGWSWSASLFILLRIFSKFLVTDKKINRLSGRDVKTRNKLVVVKTSKYHNQQCCVRLKGQWYHVKPFSVCVDLINDNILPSEGVVC